MPNILDSTGLTVKTFQEIFDEIEVDFQTIYGADIDTDPESPDGQMIGIFAQAVVDTLGLLTQIYNGFNPDNAIGRTLDQRVALNGIQRQGGTFTITPIDVVVDRALTLEGLDAAAEDPDGTGYTVEDDAGNQFILLATQNPGSPGTYTYNFRAKDPGAVQTVPNTITTPVTIVLGVVSVNNPSSALSVGLEEETDVELRVRRQKSVAIGSQGYLEGLLAALLNVSGVTTATVLENPTGSTDGDGIPGHSIWVIVSGGTDADIAQAIYQKRNAGCGMFGAESVIITRGDGSSFEINFDRVTPENLFMQFTLTRIKGTEAIDEDAVKSYLVENWIPGVDETVDINELATFVQDYDDDLLVTSAGLSLTASGYTNTLSPSARNNQFTLDTANMDVTGDGP